LVALDCAAARADAWKKKAYPWSMVLAMATVSDCIYQAAAIPVKAGLICLISSSSGRRWVIPKGCLERNMTTAETALQESWEEAGVVGVLSEQPVGTYLYDKYGATCHVTVYLMQVTRIAKEWPEAGWRRRRWLEPSEAAARVEEKDLAELLRAVALAQPQLTWSEPA
jgi:8-oxo-dGTP pyrophosphatase MutT (NUDIX family)